MSNMSAIVVGLAFVTLAVANVVVMLARIIHEKWSGV